MNEDREIWEQICAGEVAAFSALYRSLAPRLCAFIRQITGDMEAAEDIVQETFIGFWKQPAGYNPEYGTLRAWLFGVGKKRAAEWWRQRRPSAAEGPERVSGCDPELSSIVGETMAKLPQEQRLLLWLREIEGHSYQELSAILNVPIGTVRSRLFAAREALRDVWHASAPEREVSDEVR